MKRTKINHEPPDGVDTLLQRLCDDGAFRRSFAESPRRAIEAAGIHLNEEQLYRIEQSDLPRRAPEDGSFDDDQVLRCSVGY